MFVGIIIFKKENNLNRCSWILMIYLYLRGSWGPSDTIYNFRALKLSTLENFRALKLSNLDNFRALKPSNLVTGTTSPTTTNIKQAFRALPVNNLFFLSNLIKTVKGKGKDKTRSKSNLSSTQLQTARDILLHLS